MAKFVGLIGYARPVESSPGIWLDEIIEKNYRGDIISKQVRVQTSDQVNDNINIENSISILADAYAYDNIGIMKYVVWQKTAWKVQSINVNRPRIVLQIGGVYNGERPAPTP